MNIESENTSCSTDPTAHDSSATTLALYAQRVQERGLLNIPQPYGRSVAEYIQANRVAGLPDAYDMPELIAHLLRDLDAAQARLAEVAQYAPPPLKLRKFTKRKSATGKGYPQCQHVSSCKQCEKPVYADSRCWEHQGFAP